MVRLILAIVVLCLAAGCTSGTAPDRRSSSPASATTSPTSPTSPPPPSSPSSSSQAPAPAPAQRRYAHIVVAVLENRAYSDIIGNAEAPFLNSLAHSGVLLTQSYAVTHPSEPNYLALFSGSTQGLVDDSCPHTYTSRNLASALRAAQLSFVGYSEDLPSVGYTGCSSGGYARKHNPWVNFPALPPSVNQPLTAFPRRYPALPSVAFVVPNIVNDMHDGTVAQGDQWLRAHLGRYAAWARTHDSLLIVTFDEDDGAEGNRIATILAGAHLRAGQYRARVEHYSVLRTILDSCRVAPFGLAAHARPIRGVWRG